MHLDNNLPGLGGKSINKKSKTGKSTKQRRTHKVKMSRISLNISAGLLELTDEAADKDFTTRSDIIRAALLWYLRPQGREFDQTDPDIILKTLQHRHAVEEMNKTVKDFDRYD